jgi:tetrahydromethanopterin:alpha-L-glutamate ligase
LRFSTLRPTGLDLPGFDTLPNAVHVRTMSGGSFEAITRRLGVLHALQRLGVRVMNDSRAIEACVDKSMTSFLVAQAGIATPDTWAFESLERARALVDRECATGPLVLKPLFGAQGKGLRLVRGQEDLPSVDAVAGVYYFQRFETVGGEGFHDFRLFVCGGRVAASMMRRAPTWITNVKQGAEPFAVARDARLEALALAAARAVGAEIAGVDLIIGAEGPKVLEVNSMPAWRGLQKVTDANIADLIAGPILQGLA